MRFVFVLFICIIFIVFFFRWLYRYIYILEFWFINIWILGWLTGRFVVFNCCTVYEGTLPCYIYNYIYIYMWGRLSGQNKHQPHPSDSLVGGHPHWQWNKFNFVAANAPQIICSLGDGLVAIWNHASFTANYQRLRWHVPLCPCEAQVMVSVLCLSFPMV